MYCLWLMPMGGSRTTNETCHRSSGWDMYYAHAARHLITAGADLDDLQQWMVIYLAGGGGYCTAVDRDPAHRVKKCQIHYTTGDLNNKTYCLVTRHLDKRTQQSTWMVAYLPKFGFVANDCQAQNNHKGLLNYRQRDRCRLRSMRRIAKP